MPNIEKLDMHSPDKVAENIAKIGNLFPNCITETLDEKGNPVHAIDFDMLRQELSKAVVDGPKERYQFTWPDKKKSMLLANTPISATLRPCRAESVNFDTTENLYIEGDNLDVLKLLQETYLGKVKMIYIDPPYNTGNDFVYADNFDIDNESYKEISGDYDDQGNRLRKNNDTNGRFHTDWLNMMYPRLKLARDLLSEEGLIFISIDDNEIDNLKKVCSEILGEINFLACLVWQKKYAATNDAKGFSITHDYILVFSKSLSFTRNLLPRTEDQNAPYKHDDGDGKGLWRSDNLLVKSFSKSGVYPIINPNTGKEYFPPEGSCWRASKDTMTRWLMENRIYFGKDGVGAPQLKRYLNEVQQGSVPITWLPFTEVGHNDMANKEVADLFQSKAPFDTPKPVKLIQRFSSIATDKNSIILDFFSGSATTAHAVMQLNAEDGGNRKFIMVQIPEATDETSEAFKAGYKNICEIGKERIRRAGKKIREENSGKTGIENLDCGFRVLKLDSSNMKDVHYSPEEFVNNPTLFDQVHDNIKEDRTGEDLLFQVMLDLGLELSAPIKNETISGKTVYTVKDNYLIACFDNDVTDELLTQIAKRKPFYAVLRDRSFTRDDTASNFEQIFATWSPETIKKVL